MGAAVQLVLRGLVEVGTELRDCLRAQKPGILQSIADEKACTDETTGALVQAIEAFKTQFAPSA